LGLPLAHNFIVPFFITAESCPGRCVFCRVEVHTKVWSQRSEPQDIDSEIRRYLSYPKSPPERVELAFYGGSFTALDGPYRRRLLTHARDLKRQGIIKALRVSTRPDCLNEEELKELAWAGVDTVEMGAQSLVEAVLYHCRRGHTAQDVREAAGRLTAAGFKTGIHLMMGLPGDSREGFIFSVRETIGLKPDFVRIHPTLVLTGTPLALAMTQGEYHPLSREEAIAAGKTALKMFAAARIPVARLGLQETDELRSPGVILGGYHNPAFRSEVEEEICFDYVTRLADRVCLAAGKLELQVACGDMSSWIGRKRRNLERLTLALKPRRLAFRVDHQLSRGWVVFRDGGNWVKENIFTEER
jgi:histone acetyltransferase (RNA polymerase elongator complex component)